MKLLRILFGCLCFFGAAAYCVVDNDTVCRYYSGPFLATPKASRVCGGREKVRALCAGIAFCQKPGFSGWAFSISDEFPNGQCSAIMPLRRAGAGGFVTDVLAKNKNELARLLPKGCAYAVAPRIARPVDSSVCGASIEAGPSLCRSVIKCTNPDNSVTVKQAICDANPDLTCPEFETCRTNGDFIIDEKNPPKVASDEASEAFEKERKLVQARLQAERGTKPHSTADDH